MSPIAFHLGPLAIRWYGVFIASGFLAGYGLAQRRSRGLGLPPEASGDLAFTAMVGGIFGARLLYVLQNWDTEFRGNLLEALKVYRGGLVFYGGFIGAAVVVCIWSRRRKWPYPAIGDLAAPSLSLGQAFGRLGCLFNGCCFGRPYSGPLGLTYPGTAAGALNGPLYVQRQLHLVSADSLVCRPVFPIQLVSSLLNAGLCLALLALSRRSAWRGRLFPLYLVAYGTLRFLAEFGRGDYLSRPGGLTSAQWTCFLLVGIGAFWLHRVRGSLFAFSAYVNPEPGAEDG